MVSDERGDRSVRRRPRVALVTHEVSGQQGIGRAIRELILRTHDRVDYVVVARELPADLQRLVEWRCAPAPDRPFRLKLGVFFVTGAARLLGTRCDLVNLHVSGPLVPSRSDLTSLHFFRAGWYEALGVLDPRRPARSRLVPRAHLALERWCHRRARMLSVLSAAEQRVLAAHFPERPVVVTPDGVDLDRFRPDAEARRTLRAEEDVADDELVVLFVGNSWSRKGLVETIEGVAGMTSAQPARLWVVGYGDEPRYRRLAAEAGLEDRVRFFGVLPGVERAYQAADVFVQPTLYETFCLAAYEAAACGLPVVATRVSGVDELIGEGETGIAIERRSEDVSQALDRLAVDPDLRRTLGEAGRARALGFTWDRYVDRMLAAYSDLLGTPL